MVSEFLITFALPLVQQLNVLVGSLAQRVDVVLTWHRFDHGFNQLLLNISGFVKLILRLIGGHVWLLVNDKFLLLLLEHPISHLV